MKAQVSEEKETALSIKGGDTVVCEKQDYQTTSLWKQNKFNGNWQLFYDSQEKRNGINQKVFKTLKVEEEYKLGSVVITKDGFYKLLKITENEETQQASIFSVKDQHDSKKLKTIQVPIHEISLTFTVQIYLFGEVPSITKITLLASGNTEDLFNKIRELRLVKEEDDFVLVGNGSIIHEGIFYDQLDFKDKMKILITMIPKKESILKRFTIVKRLGYYQKDHLTINVNKKIKLTGLGIMCPCQGTKIVASLRIIEGLPSSEEKCIANEECTLPVKVSESDATALHTLKTPILIPPFKNISFIVNFAAPAYFFFGCDGKPKVDLENNLIISFSKEGNRSSHSNSNSLVQNARGLLGELHYVV